MPISHLHLHVRCWRTIMYYIIALAHLQCWVLCCYKVLICQQLLPHPKMDLSEGNFRNYLEKLKTFWTFAFFIFCCICCFYLEQSRGRRGLYDKMKSICALVLLKDRPVVLVKVSAAAAIYLRQMVFIHLCLDNMQFPTSLFLTF